MEIKFNITHPGDYGIHSFCDTITVTIASSDPGGDPGEFEKFLLETLSDWYYGGSVEKAN